MVRIVQVIGYSVLMTAGLAIWCIPTSSLMNVRDGDYDHAGALLAFAGSVQLLWLLIVLIVLPFERLEGRGPGPAQLNVDAQDRRPDPGSVPASALRTKVILPPTAPDEPVRRTADLRAKLPTQREQ
jgi:hypothetical protein